VVLDAVVVSSPDFTIVAPASGTLRVGRVSGPAGSADLAVGTVSGTDGAAHAVMLPAHSRLDAWIAHDGDSVTLDMPLAVATYSGFVLHATVAPEILSGLSVLPLSAQGQIVKGPGPAECRLLGTVGLPVAAPPAPDPATPGGVPAADPAADAVVNCALPRDLALMTGMRGLLALVTASVHGAAVLPSDAIAGDSQRGSVYIVLADGSTALRTVQLGVSDGDRIQILSGLSVGDTVAIPAPDLDPSAGQ